MENQKIHVTQCNHCGEKYNLNILTGECYKCGNMDPVNRMYICNFKVTDEHRVHGIITKDHMEIYVYTVKDGIKVAEGYREYK